MTLATKNGSLIVKDGKVAENCGCCGGWWCYDGYGACCFGNPVSVVVSLSAFVECIVSSERRSIPAESQTAVASNSFGVPAQDAWTHQVGRPASGSTEGRSVRLRLAESQSAMQFTVLISGILVPGSFTFPCGTASASGIFCAVQKQPTEAKPCTEVTDARRWDWIIGKSFSSYLGGEIFNGGPGTSYNSYKTFCKLDILGVVYS